MVSEHNCDHGLDDWNGTRDYAGVMPSLDAYLSLSHRSEVDGFLRLTYTGCWLEGSTQDYRGTVCYTAQDATCIVR